MLEFKLYLNLHGLIKAFQVDVKHKFSVNVTPKLIFYKIKEVYDVNMK